LEREKRIEELRLVEENTKAQQLKDEISKRTLLQHRNDRNIDTLFMFKVQAHIQATEAHEKELTKRITDFVEGEKEDKKTLAQLKDAVKTAKGDNEIFEQHVKAACAKLKLEG